MEKAVALLASEDELHIVAFNTCSGGNRKVEIKLFMGRWAFRDIDRVELFLDDINES
jgi:hypothetical protein